MYIYNTTRHKLADAYGLLEIAQERHMNQTSVKKIAIEMSSILQFV